MNLSLPPAPLRRMNRARLGALVLLLTVAATWLWAHEGHLPLPTRGALVDPEKGQVNLSPDARVALDVRTAEVALESLEERVVGSATLVAPWQRHAYVTSQLAGRVTAVRVLPGQTIDRDEPLAYVQSPELEALQLELLTARNDARLAAENLRHLEETSRAGGVSDQTVEDVRSRHEQLAQAAEVARLKLVGVGVDEAVVRGLMDDPDARPVPTLAVRSPIAGVVTRADVQVGQPAGTTDHLFEVVDLSTVWVKVDVLEKDRARVTVGQPLEVRLATGEVFRTAVQVKGLALDPRTRQGTAWAEASNPPSQPPRLLPGMFGQAALIFLAHRAVTIPASAVISDGAERFVLVEEGPGQYVRQNVVVGRRSRDRVEVIAGQFVPGDRVVTVGGHELGSFFGRGSLRLSPEAARRIGLAIEPARRRTVDEVLELSGLVELPPPRQAAVSSPLAGTVHCILIDRDQQVRAGEPLAEVRSVEFQQLQLEMLQSHLQLQLLEQTLARLRRSATEGAVPQRRLRETESARRSALQRRESYRRRLEAAGLTPVAAQGVLDRQRPLAALPLRSPIDGVVVRSHAALGHAVKPEDPLFEVHDLSRPLVRGFVSPAQLAAVRVGQKARVRLLAEGSALAEGVVVRSGQALGTADRTLSVWVELKPGPAEAGRVLAGLGVHDGLGLAAWAGPPWLPPRGLPGALARLALVVSEQGSVLAVPRTAVLREGTRPYLFVRRADGSFERRPVTTGRSDDRFVAITAGLREGEEVAVSGVADLQTAYATIK